MIGYSDATIITPNYLQIMRPKASLATVLLLQYHSCGGCFVIRLHLIPLISDQNDKKFDEIFVKEQPNSAYVKRISLLPWPHGLGHERGSREM